MNEELQQEGKYSLCSFQMKIGIQIIEIVKSLEKSGLLIDGATETVKYEIWKQKGGFSGVMMALVTASLTAPMASSLIKSAASLLVNAIPGKGVMRAGKRKEGGILSPLALLLMTKVLGRAGKQVRRAGKG